MRTLSLLLVMVLTATSLLMAQEDKKPAYGWKNSVVGDLNFTQNAFDNWQQGGENSWSWALNINAKFENDQEKYNWSNSGKLALGQTQIGDADPRKAADEIKVESVYTYKLGVLINPYISGALLTQATKGYTYDPKVAVSDFFDPAYLTESVGVGFKPNEIIKTRLGAALKQTLTNTYTGYADDPATTTIEDFKNEIGAESVTDINWKVSERILYVGKLGMFTNFEGLNTVDVDWDNTFSAMVSEIIKVSFNIRLYYDRDVSPKRQLKQTLAVGLSYTFL
ncbi:MAG: DUF3078 domain-containing protein [Calditrichaeota bacterium]|nr:MAG: DUF3078 domain-containing protein [Calditrichota bacterium]